MHQRTAMFLSLAVIVMLLVPTVFVVQGYSEARARYFAAEPEVEPTVVTLTESSREIFVPPAPVIFPIY